MPLDTVQFLSWFSGVQPFLILTSIYILTWHKLLSNKHEFLIDDDLGIGQFSDKWRPEGKNPDGTTYNELLVDYVNHEVGKDKDGKPVIEGIKNLSYNKTLGFPGAFMRWHRLHIGKQYKVIGKNVKGHDVYGWVQSPLRHHLWSLLWHGLSLVLGYRFLDYHFGPEVAFPAILLYSIHPIISQCVAWISGINYLYCLSFLFANYNVLQIGLTYHWTIPLTVLFTALSSMSLLVGCFNFAILWVLGYHWEAFSALLVGGAVFLRDGLTVVSYRRAEFKKQNMTSTLNPNIRKPIIMLKTLWYYICLITIPKSLGLYHEWGYHYGRKDEFPTFMFWAGLLSVIGLGAGFYYGNDLIRLCVVWFLAYFLVFSNFFTANQFVVERYAFIPSFAFCVLFGWLVYPYKPLFWFLIGLYAMRSIMHVWTFKTHINFYQSNALNFPHSEVAMGNLGCAYQNRGMSGSAYDAWVEATKINPFYDVPWYNMASIVKGLGDLEKAREYLGKCLNAEVVHFKDTWAKEMQELDSAILKKQCFESLNQEMNVAVNSSNFVAVSEIKRKMDILMKPETKVSLAPVVKAPT